MEPVEQKVDEVKSLFETFKKENDKRLDLLEKGRSTADQDQKIARIETDLKKAQDEVAATRTALNRGGQGGGNDEGKEAAMKAKTAFEKWARKGDDDAYRAELKAMSVNSDPDGGFLVRPEVSSEIVKKVFESTPIRQLASVISIGSDSLEMISDLDEASSGWVGETASRAATNTPVLKKIKIPVHELYAKPQVSQKLLDDAEFNVETWLGEKVSSKFGRDEATAFVSGDGVGKPRGFLTYASGTSGFEQIEQVVSGSATLLVADAIINISHKLKEAYLANASWLMQRATVAEVRKLKDSQGRYLWEPGIAPDDPDRLAGKPLFYANDMQAVGTLNNLIIAFGDFRAGYQIVDRLGVRVLRDPYSAKPYVEFYTTKRVGGDVKNFEAIKLMKVST